VVVVTSHAAEKRRVALPLERLVVGVVVVVVVVE
jgi:hypothetical protein